MDFGSRLRATGHPGAGCCTPARHHLHSRGRENFSNSAKFFWLLVSHPKIFCGPIIQPPLVTNFQRQYKHAHQAVVCIWSASADHSFTPVHIIREPVPARLVIHNGHVYTPQLVKGPVCSKRKKRQGN